MSERRYNDEEVAAIFARASEEEQSATHQLSAAGEGLTLAELQEIGREAGIAPDRVAKAVRSLDDVRQPAPPRFLGLPLGVSRTVKLDHRLTDEEWERLVVDLRETFDARGVVRTEGSLRHWANGNLQVLVEPDGDGQRIRFRTVKGNSRALMMGGLGMLGVAAVTTLATMLFPTTGASQALDTIGTIALMGAGMFTIGALRLPSWARLRRQQMEDVAQRLTSPR
jgi:hypothetical protein